MNHHNQSITEIGTIYESLKDRINNIGPACDASTEAHKLLMQLREITLGFANENNKLKALKEIQSHSESLTIGDVLTSLYDHAPKIPVKILDPDASRDDALAVSKIDRISVIETNPNRAAGEQTEFMVLLQKNMDVEWLPGSLKAVANE